MRITPRLAGRFFTKVRDGTRYMFGKHLLLTNVALSAGLSGVGDTILQHYEKYETKDKQNLRRTMNMSISGATIGVFCHYWYIFLDKRFTTKRVFKVAMKKMLVDQIIASPISIGIFFVTMAVLERSSADEFLKELRCKSWRLYLAEWVIWPPAQLFNFFALPLRFRVLFDNTVSLCYDIYTSYVKHDLEVECQSASKSLEFVSSPSPTHLCNSLKSQTSATTVSL